MTKSRYGDFPNHPLRFVPQELLDVVRDALLEVEETGDIQLEADMRWPIADSLVQAVVEAGWNFRPPKDCEAVIHHGPGHQSKTRCELWSQYHETDEHGDDVHYANTLGYVLEWTGNPGFD